ncbi:hypothetical protein DFH29DRAFT_550448 [Suillus ampliporus]|nr:hypothetical protein DFH29DRAFT_550448 [Suillus ampliporus]
MDSIKHLHRQLIEKEGEDCPVHDFAQGTCIGSLALATRSSNPNFSSLSPGFPQLGTRLLVALPKGKGSHAVDQNMPTMEGRCCGHAQFVVYLRNWRGNWEQAAFCYNSWLKRSQGFPLSLALNCYEDDVAKLRSLLQPTSLNLVSLYRMSPRRQSRTYVERPPSTSGARYKGR